MNNIDIYIKCLVLRYRERDKNVNSNSLVEKILNFYNPEEDKNMGDENEKIESFKEFVKIYNKDTSKYTKKTLLEQLSIILMGYPEYVTGISEMLNDNSYTQDDIDATRNELIKYAKQRELMRLLSETLRNIRQGKTFDSSAVLSQFKNLNEAEKEKDTLQVMELENIEDVSTVAKKAVELNNNDNRIKTGFAKMNKALDGGFRQGEFVMIGALRFNYKSGILRTLFLQIPFHNTPKVTEGKTPMLLYIGFEDTQETNLSFSYNYLYCNEFGKAPEKDVTDAEMSKYVTDKLKSTPYKCVMVRADPGNFNLSKVIGLIDSYIDKGYEIQACMIDYLSKIAPKGINGEANHDTLKQTYQDAYEEISKKRNILTITAHQLSSGSRDIAFGGSEPKDFVKFLPGRGATENCKSLDQIVDIEMYCHVYTDKMTNTGYLSFQVGKHRLSPTTPDQYKYFTARFIPNGSLIEKDANAQDGVFVDNLLV